MTMVLPADAPNPRGYDVIDSYAVDSASGHTLKPALLWYEYDNGDKDDGGDGAIALLHDLKPTY
jgi:hypothetical protein